MPNMPGRCTKCKRSVTRCKDCWNAWNTASVVDGECICPSCTSTRCEQCAGQLVMCVGCKADVEVKVSGWLALRGPAPVAAR